MSVAKRSNRRGFRARQSSHRKSTGTILESLEIRRLLATVTWDGGGGADTDWSNPLNWSTNQAPVAGDALVFAGTQSLSSFNDFAANTTFQSITFNAGGFDLLGNPLRLSAGINSATGDNSIAFAITLTADQKWRAGGGRLSLNGDVNNAGFWQTVEVAASGSQAFSGGSRGSGRLIKVGAGQVILGAANTYSGTTSILDGTLVLPDGGSTGTGAVSISSGAVVAGSGFVTGALTVTGSINPGQSSAIPAQLDTLDATINGQAVFDLTSGGVGGYDQLGVFGTLTLGASSALSTPFQYVPATGEVFTLIENDGTDAVVGTFAGLAEGAVYYANGSRMTISYVGGDGNDVTVTVGPVLWDGGGADNLWSTATNWAGDVAVAVNVGQDLVFAGPARVTAFNDLTTFLSYGSLTFLDAFSLGGNAIGIDGGITAQGALTLDLDLLLQNHQTFSQVSSLASINGDINTAGHTLTLAGAGDYDIRGVISGNGALTKTGLGTLSLQSASTYSGGTTVSAGILSLRGEQAYPSLVLTGSGAVTIAAGGALEGMGRTPALVSNGSIRPMASNHGLALQTGNLQTHGALEFEVRSFTPGGTGVASRISVTGGVTVGAAATLGIDFQHVDPGGTVYTLIDNDGTDAISGRFAGVAQRNILTHVGPDSREYLYRVSYTGGTGNDLTLTRIAPGTFQFSGATYVVNEEAGSATITVQRTNGSHGSVSVPWGIGALDGAVPGEDFESASGVLVFADGQTGATFTITILDDAVLEDAESMELVLGDPTGGGELGTRDTATLTIPANDAATIGGRVFRDADRDTALDADETGLAGRTVFIDDDADGILDEGESSDVTDVAGAYRFEGLSAGPYSRPSRGAGRVAADGRRRARGGRFRRSDDAGAALRVDRHFGDPGEGL